MDAKLITLKLFLDALGQPFSIDSVEARKRVQKAVYLGQLSGVDLGYRFSWYIMGPYSTALTRDYYAMSEHESIETNANSRELRSDVRSKLSRLTSLLRVPENLGLNDASWLELLASWHYLRVTVKKSEQEAEEIFRASKPNLLPYLAHAKSALSKHGLL